jgi:short-subunit dehydrogenase
MAVYYATKHYVLAFSDGLAEELAGSGVTVTTLAPGPTASGFQARAGAEASRLFERHVMDAATVARAGLAGALAGKRLVVPGLRNRLQTHAARFLPHRLVAASVARAQPPR